MGTVVLWAASSSLAPTGSNFFRIWCPARRSAGATAIHRVVSAKASNCPELLFHMWYLDDGAIAGPKLTVLRALCKKLDIRYRIICVYFKFTHQESHLRNEPVSHCAYFEYPQPHHVRLEGFTKQCLRIPLCDTLHRIRCWVRTPILFMVY